MECLNNLFTSEKNSYFGGDVIVSFLPVYVIPNTPPPPLHPPASVWNPSYHYFFMNLSLNIYQARIKIWKFLGSKTYDYVAFWRLQFSKIKREIERNGKIHTFSVFTAFICASHIFFLFSALLQNVSKPAPKNYAQHQQKVQQITARQWHITFFNCTSVYFFLL